MTITSKKYDLRHILGILIFLLKMPDYITDMPV
jgi:hypothetical protein